MLYLVEALLFLSPLAGYVLWRRWRPNEDAGGRMLVLAGAALLLGLALAIGYGVWRSGGRSSAYRPAVLGTDGAITPGRMEPRP